MKRIFVFIFLFRVFFECAGQVEFYSSSALRFPLKESPDDFSLKNDSGVKLKIRSLRASLITGINTTDFYDLANCTRSEFEEMQKYRYGARYSLKSSIINADFMAGTLCFSQGISRLKKSYFSVPSALKKPSLLVPGISPALPTWTSSVTPLALSLSVAPGKRVSFFPTVQTAFLETGELYAGIFKRFSFRFVPSGSLSFSGGLFDCGRENTDSWFQKQRYFSAERRISGESELNLVYSHFRLSAAAGIHESPFGGIYSWGRIQDFILAGDFVLHSFFYLADSSMITADKSEPGIRSQAGINPQYTFWFGKSSLNTGLLACSSFRKTVDKVPEYYNEYCIKTSASLSVGRYVVSSDLSADYCTEDEIYEYSARLKLSAYFSPLSISSVFSFKNEESDKNTFYFSGYVYPKRTVINSCGLSFSVTEHDGALDFTPVFSAAFRGGSRGFKWNIRTSFSLNF